MTLTVRACNCFKAMVLGCFEFKPVRVFVTLYTLSQRHVCLLSFTFLMSVSVCVCTRRQLKRRNYNGPVGEKINARAKPRQEKKPKCVRSVKKIKL